MISLLTGSYNDDDYEIVARLSLEMAEHIPCEGSCEMCSHKNSCADIQRFAKYANEKHAYYKISKPFVSKHGTDKGAKF